MIKNLREHKYAQCYVIINENRIQLISYSTIVIDAEIVEIMGAKILQGYIAGLYSATTRKHIGYFSKEYCNCYYQTFKRAFEQGGRFNLPLTYRQAEYITNN